MPAIAKQCERCKKDFLAEGEWSETAQQLLFMPTCYDCDEEVHQQVDDILRQRGYGEPE